MIYINSICSQIARHAAGLAPRHVGSLFEARLQALRLVEMLTTKHHLAHALGTQRWKAPMTTFFGAAGTARWLSPGP
jgi:hypothetical protein